MTTETELITTGYTIYRPDGTEERGSVDWPDNPSLKQIKGLVEPIVAGPMEHVTVLDPAKTEAFEVSSADHLDLFVDELSHVRDTGPSPRNEAATRIYRANWLRAHPDDAPENSSWIAGTAVLFDRIIWR